MYLLTAIKSLLIFTVFFVERFIAASTSAVSDSSPSVASTALHECCFFGQLCPLHNCLAVLVEEVQIMLAVLRVLVVPCGEVILQVHFQVSMLGAALSKESIGKVALFVILMCD